MYQLGRGSDPVMVVGSLISLVARYMLASPDVFAESVAVS